MRKTGPKGSAEQWDAGYPRVSTDIQMERDSLANQEQALDLYAKLHGLSLRLYREEGVSAKDTERPKLQELLADVRAGRVRSVIVTKLDRISRSLRDLLDLMAEFEEHGVKFISLRDNIDTSGPVGRFMLHILGAIAELERGITAERVAEDMKLRAQRGKWNGGLAPYGRRIDDGKLLILPEEGAVLHRMRTLLLDKRTWRGVAVTLNREGVRTRGWEPVERQGRVVRKGHAPGEWTPWSIKRVLLQRINEGTLVYNRRDASGRTIVARPDDEHIVVPEYCEPIFSHEEMDELLRVASEMESTPSRTKGSPHLLSGLVYCACGTRMYGIRNYVNTKGGRYPLMYYRCRRASHSGTCGSKQMPAAVIEPLIRDQMRLLALQPERVRSLVGDAQATFEADVQPLREQQEAARHRLDRVRAKSAALLELAEDRLISKEEFTARRARLESECVAAEAELGQLDAELTARSSSQIDMGALASSLKHVADVYDELVDIADRRRLLGTCLNRVVVRGGALELHVPLYPLLITPADGATDGSVAPLKIPAKFQARSPDGGQNGAKSGRNGRNSRPALGELNSNWAGVSARTDALAVSTATASGPAPAQQLW